MKKKDNKEHIEFMNKVAKDIIDIKIPNNDISILNLNREFYSIMRKYGIKQGTRSQDGNGIICSNPEWTICHVLYENMIQSKIQIFNFLRNIPKDLQCY